MMLKKIELSNFRCFERTSLSFKELTVIVGKNNAGKSTLIEALRLVSYACKRVGKITFETPNQSLGLPLHTKGIAIKTDRLQIDLSGVVYYYKEEISTITATFANNAKIIIHLNDLHAFATIHDASGNIVKSKASAAQIISEGVNILPQIGLIKDQEKLLTDATVSRDMDTYLSSRHFRNELLRFKDSLFEDFRRLSEETWDRLRIRELEHHLSSGLIELLIEDDGFTTEIGSMGSGLQMWLQIMWFICKSNNSETIILDEPDVYMHPDLQRKILNILKIRYKQIIIATHSVEIISEVSHKNIVTVNKDARSQQYLKNSYAIQSIIDAIGSVHNISLVRLSTAKKCLFVEGKDIYFLSKIHEKINPLSIFSLKSIPCIPLGGWSRLENAFGTSKLFESETNGDIKTYCILDRDYYNDETIQIKLNKAKEHGLTLHIWSKKEIENYFIIPRAIFRIMNLSEKEFDEFMIFFESIIESFKQEIIDQYAQKILETDRSKQLPTCNKLARTYVDNRWTSIEEKINIVPGKDFISCLNGAILEKYNEQCSLSKIIKSIRCEELDEEIKNLVSMLCST